MSANAEPRLLESYSIGRSDSCDLVIPNPFVSSRHALVEVYDDGTFVFDEGSTNGTLVGGEQEPIAEAEVDPDTVVFLSSRYRTTVRSLINRARLGSRNDARKQYYSGEKEVVTLGKHPDCDLVIDTLGVAQTHAEIRNEGGTRRIADLGTELGTYLNGERLSGDNRRFSEDDVIEIAGYTVNAQFEPGDPNLSVGVEREGVFVTAENVSVSARNGRGSAATIVDAASVSIRPGEFFGLMGPSGCGKTTLMGVLLGTTRPSDGAVYYNGLDLHDNYGRLSQRIGYVPQEEIMHSDLTVREVLYYSAKLKVPSTVSDDEIHERIDRICDELGIGDKTETLIGSPENKTLSGGEKKRVNLGIELLTDPNVLFLDEPTSGLSSKDAVIVMEKLRSLAIEKSISMMIAIHQPSLKIYKLLDKVVYLKDGKVTYYGEAYPDSIKYFCPETPPDVAGPDAAMEALEDLDADIASARFHARLGEEPSGVGKYSPAGQGGESDSGKKRSEWTAPLRQLSLLTRRYLKCKLRDRGALGIMIGQAPLIGVTLVLALYENSINMAVFLLVLCSIWFGVNNSAREIVGERTIYERERRDALRSLPYLLSKFVVQALLSLVQCVLLLAVARWGLELQFPWATGIGIAWLAALAGIAIGLFISVISKNEVSAISLVPLVIIPFFVFSGALKSYDEMGGVTKSIANVTPSRWSYELMVISENHEDRETRSWEKTKNGKYALRPFSQEIKDDFTRDERALWCVLVLVGFVLLFTAASWVALLRGVVAN